MQMEAATVKHFNVDFVLFIYSVVNIVLRK